ncbi:hypothetical protein A3SI_17389 [Nitritalea halalkaliphila LW7]|uniref:UBA/THIF-type NAD/FAD binding protein n=1 Tax=Nitritalea halalkaliphila LW7 TaxID=1189621 RepID=I5BVU3_9BACT|nr:hypothetical protein A3SI_17389 [Nitritalea halalkaliphila LW7]
MTDPFAWLSRTELITGRAGLEKLARKHVLVVGLGGVAPSQRNLSPDLGWGR